MGWVVEVDGNAIRNRRKEKPNTFSALASFFGRHKQTARDNGRLLLLGWRR
jgi:hypothetical protein